jgi:hypothetical protein
LERPRGLKLGPKVGGELGFAFARRPEELQPGVLLLGTFATSDVVKATLPVAGRPKAYPHTVADSLKAVDTRDQDKARRSYENLKL